MLTQTAFYAAILIIVFASTPALGLIQGQADDDTPETNATVKVEGCTGALVADNIVLTAGHYPCTDHGERPREIEAKAGICDWERNDVWYPILWNGFEGCLPRGVDIYFGADSANFSAAMTVRARYYSVPDCADALAYKLERSVPRNIAVPARVVTQRREFEQLMDSPAFLQMVGWGHLDPDPEAENPAFPAVRQRAFATFVGYPRGGNGMLEVEGAFGSGTRQGDSGGPLYVIGGAGNASERLTVGIMRQVGDPAGGLYTATFAGSASDASGKAPRVGPWLDRVLSGRLGHDETIKRWCSFINKANGLGLASSSSDPQMREVYGWKMDQHPEVLWRFEPVGDRVYIVHEANGLALAVNSSEEWHDKAYLWNRNGHDDLLWRRDDLGDGYVRFQSNTTGEYLAASYKASPYATNPEDVNQVYDWQDNGHTDLEWQMVPAGNGAFMLLNHSTGMALWAPSGSQQGALAKVVAPPMHPDLHWRVVPREPFYYELVHRSTGLLLTALSPVRPGTRPITSDGGNAHERSWSFEPLSDRRTFMLQKTGGPGLILGMPASRTSNDTPVSLFAPSTAVPHHWQSVPAPGD